MKESHSDRAPSLLAQRVGIRLREIRKASKLPHNAICEKASCTASQLRKIEGGRDFDFLRRLDAIAAAVGTTAEAILATVISQPAIPTRNAAIRTPGQAILRENLTTMDEQTLRRDVLSPLFRAMQYEHPTETHGGALEQGKDFVLWERSRSGAIQCIGVVVKSGNITGSATGGSGTAATVATQIRQCLGRSWPHPTTHVEMPVNRCWVIASGIIKKEAEHSLASELDDATRARVEYTGGNALYKLVEKYLGPQTTLELLQDAASRMQPAAPADHHVVTFASANGAVGVSLHPHEGVDPLTFGVQILKAPGAADDTKVHSALKALLSGGMITDKDGVNVALSPSAMVAAMMPAGESFTEWTIKSILRPYHTVLTFAAYVDDELVGLWPHVIVAVTRTGKDSTEWRVDDRREPLTMHVTQGAETNTFNIRVSAREGDEWNADATRISQSLQFIGGLKRATRLRILDDRSGLLAVEAEGPFTGDVSFGKSFVELFDACASVQKTLQKRIAFPRSGVPADEANVLLELGTLLQRRIFEMPISDASANFMGDSEEAAKFIHEFSTGATSRPTFMQQHLQEYAVVGSRIAILVNDIYLGLTLADESVQLLQQFIDRASASLPERIRLKAPIQLQFVAAPGDRMRIQRTWTSDVISDLTTPLVT
jgi:transcriptional regulator with XRE-family HTH domain